MKRLKLSAIWHTRVHLSGQRDSNVPIVKGVQVLKRYHGFKGITIYIKRSQCALVDSSSLLGQPP